MRSMLRALILPALFTSSAVMAEPLDRESVVDSLIEEVQAAHESKFFEIVERFEKTLEEDPEDAAAATDRCRFLSYFYYSEDFYIEEADDLFEKSEDYLDRFEKSPEVELYHLEGLYGEEVLTKGEELLDDPEILWAPHQRGKIHLALARQYQLEEDERKQYRNAELAYQLYPTIESQFLWAESLKDRDRED
ncbi:MAG: hypothetical protein AAGF67_11820, partial [Verrucomicrobiota bacterium]